MELENDSVFIDFFEDKYKMHVLDFFITGRGLQYAVTDIVDEMKDHINMHNINLNEKVIDTFLNSYVEKIIEEFVNEKMLLKEDANRVTFYKLNEDSELFKALIIIYDYLLKKNIAKHL